MSIILTNRVTRTVLQISFVVAFSSTAAFGADNPFTTHSKGLYSGIKKIVIRTAETTPEEIYGFKPADSVRTFGEIVAHVADSQYDFCSVVLGEKKTAPKIDTTKTSKADLLIALNAAFAYCDRAYDGMTDVSATEIVKFMNSSPKIGVLNVNQVHTIEHYGNLVTYLRMNNLVPPTSDPEFMKTLRRP